MDDKAIQALVRDWIFSDPQKESDKRALIGYIIWKMDGLGLSVSHDVIVKRTYEFVASLVEMETV